ncbi:MAG: FkbM family methyltransferase [Pseudomonadota bacterium]
MSSDPTLTGLARSWRTYRSNKAHWAGLADLYRPFINPGDLAFDIGAHMGDRSLVFRELGARVVAVEPQTQLVEVLKKTFRDDDAVTIVPKAVSSESGSIEFHVNSLNPSVSTASPEFIAAGRGVDAWDGQVWDAKVNIEATTLDAMIAEHGQPAFIKIDVEGFEDRVLSGLSSTPASISFEFTTISKDVGVRSLERLSALGDYRFNAIVGEGRGFVHDEWCTAADIEGWLQSLPVEANSGDIYAVMRDRLTKRMV